MGNLIIQFWADLRRVWTGAMARASVASTTAAPWDLSGATSWKLYVTVNGVAQTLTVAKSSLANPAAATAAELAGLLDTVLTGGGVYALTDGRIAFEADPATGGGVTTMQITGGALNAVLQFPTTAEQQSGYNDLLGGVRSRDDGTQAGVTGRREHPTITIRCQVDRQRWGDQAITPGGVFDVAELVLTLDMRELERRGLTRADGAPRFTRGDRLVALRRIRAGGSVEAFSDVRVTKIERAGHGLSLSDPRPNLVYLHCARDTVKQ
jgi:hypothetical protein